MWAIRSVTGDKCSCFWLCALYFSLYRWHLQKRCAQKLVCQSQDRPVRTVVCRWPTSTQEYPWVLAWPTHPDQSWPSALPPSNKLFFSSDPYWRTETCIIFSINLLLIPVFDSLTLYSFIVTKKSHFHSTNPLFQGLTSSTDLRGWNLWHPFPFLKRVWQAAS